MPDKDKQRKLNEYYSKPSSPIKSSPVKSSPVKKKKPEYSTNSPGLLAINIDDSSDESDVGGFKLAPSSQLLPAESSEDEAPVEMSPVARRRRQEANPLVRLSDNGSSSSEDDHIPLNLLPKKRKIVFSDSEQEDVRPKKRRVLKRGLRPTAEEENVLDDLDKDVVMEQRLRKPPKKTPYQKNLERLKRQRQGLPELPSSDSESGEEGSDEEIIELDSEGEEVRVKPIPGARKGDKQDSPANEEEGSDEDEFIVDDEEGAVNLPVQFSMMRAQPLVASFKVFFQLLVHVACKPNHLRATFMKARLDGGNADSEYFKHARNQLDKHLSSIRDSQVASPIWKAEFKESLERYPELKVIVIEAETYCDACRRASAISTRQVHLSGAPYNVDGYEPLDDSSDSEEEEEEGEEDVDEEDGSSNSDNSDNCKDPSNNGDTSEQDDEEEMTVFKLGQHCERRVSLFHAFTHWEFALFQVIEEKVTAVETRNREKMEKKKKKRLIDTVDPDNILDWLEKKDVVAQQWRVIQKLMERAKTVEKRFTYEVD